MKKQLLLSIVFLACCAASLAQNPKMENTYSYYSDGKLVGIGNGFESELRVMDISYSLIKKICEDYQTAFYDYPFQSLDKLRDQVNALNKENEQLKEQLKKLNDKIEKLNDLVERLEDKIN